MNGTVKHDFQMYTVNPEIFARILFSRIALKDIFVTLKICEYTESTLFLKEDIEFEKSHAPSVTLLGQIQ